MAQMPYRTILEAALSRASGGALAIRHLDGTTSTFGKDPYITVVIKSPNAYKKLLSSPSLSVGEAYMDSLIDIEGDLTQLPRLASDYGSNSALAPMLRKVRTPLQRKKGREQSAIAHHYDIGNDFYSMWLDPSLTYSCAYFKEPGMSLEAAQQAKRAHIHRKLQLQPGQHILEIGSGWGTALVEAAENYGVSGVGLTLSTEQLANSQRLAKEHGVEAKVEFRLQSYRDLTGETFDAVYSIGMYEHVGRHHGNAYFTKVNELLKDGGISVLHTITNQISQGTHPWISKYIFPGGYVPSGYEVVKLLATNNFRLIHSENLRLHYAMTLEEWTKNFKDHRAEVVEMFDERFARMWEFYLCVCSGSFRNGGLDLFQYTFTKGIDNTRPITNAYMYQD